MLKPHWDFFTAFISLHYYFTPEGQFERNVGQNSKSLKLAFTIFHSKPSNYVNLGQIWGF